MAGAYEKEVIGPRAWGRFEDLLRATAESPAMLFYLDNWLSRGSPPPGRRPHARRRGLNENYARELHERGDKVVLGQRIASGGKEEGDQVLRLLATHPSTALFISHKLARRFVADEPPRALVERAAAVFRDTGGDIRQVVRTIVTSPEFFASGTRAAKVKTPLEFVASAARAVGADVRDARALARRVAQMGMPLYLQPPPTGYKDTAEAWVSTSGLVARLNFAVDLAAGHLPGVAHPAGAV